MGAESSIIPLVVEAPPRTQMGELTRLPRPSSSWGGYSLPLPTNQIPHRPFEPQYTALRASHTSHLSKSLAPGLTRIHNLIKTTHPNIWLATGL